MNFRVTLGLGVLLVALLGAYFVVPRTEEPSTGARTGPVYAPALVGYSQDEVSGVLVKVGSDSITLRRGDGGDWTYGLGSAAPTSGGDQTRIKGLVGRLAGLKPQSRIAAEAGQEQMAEYGLGQPQIEFTVGKGNEGIALVAGSQNARRTGYYLRRTDSSAVYLVDAFLIDDLKGLITRPPVPPTPTPEPSPTAAAAPSPTS